MKHSPLTRRVRQQSLLIWVPRRLSHSQKQREAAEHVPHAEQRLSECAARRHAARRGGGALLSPRHRLTWRCCDSFDIKPLKGPQPGGFPDIFLPADTLKETLDVPQLWSASLAPANRLQPLSLGAILPTDTPTRQQTPKISR